MTDFGAIRTQMVDQQLAARGIADAAVLAAIRKVPRHRFVPPHMADIAYRDAPLPIGEGQTISQPYVVALMLEAAGIRPGDRLLEIGTGSGYSAALATEMGAKVFSIERRQNLAAAARKRLALLGYAEISVRTGDGTTGWPEAAPFDVVLVAAASPNVPETLKAQLAIGGRLVIPVGQSLHLQHLVRLERRDANSFAETDLGAVQFVPLIGAEGWRGTAT